MCTGQTPNTRLVRVFEPRAVIGEGEGDDDDDDYDYEGGGAGAGEAGRGVDDRGGGIIDSGEGAEEESSKQKYQKQNRTGLVRVLRSMQIAVRSHSPSTSYNSSTSAIQNYTSASPPKQNLEATTTTTTTTTAPTTAPKRSRLYTPHPHIFAIGDAADAFGALKAGHSAYYQGEVAARNVGRLIAAVVVSSSSFASSSAAAAAAASTSMRAGVGVGVGEGGDSEAHEDGFGVQVGDDLELELELEQYTPSEPAIKVSLGMVRHPPSALRST